MTKYQKHIARQNAQKTARKAKVCKACNFPVKAPFNSANRLTKFERDLGTPAECRVTEVNIAIFNSERKFTFCQCERKQVENEFTALLRETFGAGKVSKNKKRKFLKYGVGA